MESSGTILLVDDEREYRENVAEDLRSRGYEVLQAGDAEPALAHVRSRIVHVAFVDILMPGMDGVTLLSRLREIDPLLEVVIVTGQGTVESAVEAMRRGAFHYVTKPASLKELELVARRAMEKALTARQNRIYREDLRRRRAQHAAQGMARTSGLKHILEQAESIAQIDATVLIQGETGTGKEVLAEFIHNRSGRKEHALSVVNCGALAEQLLDAELFGYEKGAFTGADESRPGILEVADGGTLLLDEIGDLTETGQIRLLRFLERGLVRRVGSTREVSVDVRVLAATHRDLQKETAEWRFREDLYHRLNVFRIKLPALRDRPEDILVLAHHFLAMLSPPLSPRQRLGREAEEALCSYAWPGNVRELRHALERACLTARLAGEDKISPEHLGLTASPDPGNVLVPLKAAQQRHVAAVLRHVAGNRREAARILGVSERHLYRLLRRLRDKEGGRSRTPEGARGANAPTINLT